MSTNHRNNPIRVLKRTRSYGKEVDICVHLNSYRIILGSVTEYYRDITLCVILPELNTKVVKDTREGEIN